MQNIFLMIFLYFFQHYLFIIVYVLYATILNDVILMFRLVIPSATMPCFATSSIPDSEE